ncbi:MAG: SpoOJ/ParA/ParB/repB family protein [Verrucomicrobiales bacterium]|nr:SpoOJ/ParA/ParB/repB family protein [Verrucomicrobiales bacterium]
MRIQAFRGLLPRPELASQVAAVPYDVVDTEEARALAANRPYDLLHVDRAEIDLPPDTDPYSPEVYAKAAENFQKLIADGILVRDEEPGLYLYQQVMDGREQTGLIAACHVDDYGHDVIKKHEKTRQVKEDDRTNLVRALSAHTGPIFLTYRDEAVINDKVNDILASEPPLFDFTAPDGIIHRVWRVTGADSFIQAFAEVQFAYVADGHHRSASAWRVGTERKKLNSAHTGGEDYNWFLGVLFPASELRILPYNRVVLDLNGLQPEELLTGITDAGFTVSPTTLKSPKTFGSICMYLKGEWHLLTWDTSLNGGGTDPVKSLDVSVLQDLILAPLLGIDDPRTNNRIEFIGGIRGTAELERKVNSGHAAVAFSMYPTTVDQLMAIADAGEIMPPKSTWFEPKLRSGLVVQTF